jgi:multicomponent Na+:H+ antiporter subunit E
MTLPMRGRGPNPWRRAAFAVVLAVVWVLLWDGLTWGQLLAGLVVGAALVLLLPAPPPGPDSGRLTFRPVPGLRLGAWFLWQFTLSNFYVARAVLFPGRWVHTGVVHVPLRATSPALAALVANITALTPGMQPVDTRPDGSALDVHVLSLGTEEGVRAVVGRLEDLVLAAFDRDEPSRGARRSTP